MKTVTPTIPPAGPASNPRRTPPAWVWLCALLFLISHAAIVYGPFTGEDEALQWHACRRIVAALGADTPLQATRAVANVLLCEYHPPLRYLISLPGVVLLPNLELGLRLGAVLGSIAMTALLTCLGFRLKGPRCAMLTGLLIAASGVYTWTSMAFGWSWLVAFLTAAILLLWEPHALCLRDRSNMPRLWAAFACLFGAYLINSGAILFSVGLILSLLKQNSRQLRALVRLGIPVGLVYGLYWFVFLILPEHSGQLLQTSQRAGMTGLNVRAFAENLKGWNAYGLPLLFNLLWIAGLVLCARTRRHLLWLLLPFLLAWSFFLQGESHQYFLLGTLPLIPFGLAALGPKLMGTWRPATLVALVLLWNISLFQLPFHRASGHLSEVRPWLIYGGGYAGRNHNGLEPWRALAAHMRGPVANGDTWVSDLDGPFGIFYFPGEPGFAGRLNSSAYPTDNIAGWESRPDWILSRSRIEAPEIKEATQFQGSAVFIHRLSPVSTPAEGTPPQAHLQSTDGHPPTSSSDNAPAPLFQQPPGI